jgi:hypothetical protein
MRLPRIDQVSELTRGLELPLPPIAYVHLAVIFDGVKRAFDRLVAEHGGALAVKEENELNGLLQARLNSLCAEEKLLSQMVACVVRGGESISFDGKRLELRPDLGIYLTGRHRSFPLVVECKIIDGHTGKGVDLYCVNGVRRFVEGEYAWGSSQGLMVAYVRDGSTVSRTLAPHLSTNAVNNPDPFRTESMPSEEGTPPVWISRHGREFNYVGGAGGKPGPIGISHLWFKAPSATAA